MKFKTFYLLLIPFLLTGCNNSQKENDGPQKQEGEFFIKEDTTINFLCMVNDKYLANLQGMIDDFMKNEPHVKVNLYNPLGSGYYSAIERTIVSGFFKEDYPDIAQCYPDHVFSFIDRGYAVNLDDYLNNDKYGLGKEKDDYISTFFEEGQQYGQSGTYSLPFCKSTELMYYNAEALLGLNLSTIDATINNGQPLNAEYLDNLTWEELFDKLCPAIRQYNEEADADHKLYNVDPEGAIFTYDSDENFFITLANQYGYGYTHLKEEGKGSIDFDKPEMKALMKKLYDAKKEGYLQTHGSYDNYVSNLFTDKKALFTVSSNSGLSYNYNEKNPFSLGVARIPHAEGRDYSSINQGPSLCILDHKDNNRSLASYLLWKHITNETNATSWSLVTGYMGIRYSSYDNDEYNNAIGAKEKEGADKLEIATADNLIKIAAVKDQTFSTSVFKGSGDVRAKVGSLLIDVLTSDGSEETINGLFAACSEELNNLLK